jgi:hypothetical protein
MCCCHHTELSAFLFIGMVPDKQVLKILPVP